MKKYNIKLNILVGLCISAISYGQIIINADAATEKTVFSSPSVLLEFGNDGNKGIILPYVETLPTTAVPGTLIFDITTDTEYKVKVLQQDNTWKDLSIKSGFSDIISKSIKDVQNATNVKPEATEAKVIIGANQSTADGILVLESKDKAMVLPMVSDLNKIGNPSPGQIVFYEPKAGEQYLATFNGNEWRLWFPEK